MSEGTTQAIPAKLATLLDEVAHLDRAERTEMLIDYADHFVDVPPEIALRPFPETHRAPRCESEAYVWAADRPDGTLQLHFAVENPQGLSAKAWCVILDETLSGAPVEQVARVSDEAILQIFGRELSMGKGLGLIGVLELVTRAARERLARRAR